MEVPKLKNLEKFQKILADYQPSKATLDVFSRIPCVFMVGPTAAGRNTLINILVSGGNYQYLLSHTTRPPRINNGVKERNGVEYWFDSEDTFIKDLEEGLYLEAAIIHKQQVSGVSIRELEEAKTSGKIAINEVEVSGALAINGFRNDVLIIFLLPPSFDIWIERIKDRGDMSEIELRNRLESAEKEFEIALSNDFFMFVINDEIHHAAKRVDEIATGISPITAEEQDKGKKHAKKLMIDVQQFLRS